MEAVMNWGIGIIVFLQSLGGWLVPPMQFFSFLGSEEFFLVLLPFLYWCVDAGLGLRVGTILLFSSGVNDIFKIAFHLPRPYWYSDAVTAQAAEATFGLPSGHSVSAAAVWGMIASRLKTNWAWIAAVTIAFLVGLSRMILAVHFPTDVFAGWLIGAIILWFFMRFWDAATERVKPFSMNQKILIAFIFSALLIGIGAVIKLSLADEIIPADWIDRAVLTTGEEPEPFLLNGIVTAGAALFGMYAGLVWLTPRGRFDASGSSQQKALRYVIGAVIVIALYAGLGAIFPRGDALIPYIFRYVRYTAIGLWVSAGAPLLFARLKLAALR
jgi:membrane-associated phospholipid phosphatase